MQYYMTPQERDFYIQILAAEQFALHRGTSEEYLLCFREKMQFYQQAKVKYKIPQIAGMYIITDSGIIVTEDDGLALA